MTIVQRNLLLHILVNRGHTLILIKPLTYYLMPMEQNNYSINTPSHKASIQLSKLADWIIQLLCIIIYRFEIMVIKTNRENEKLFKMQSFNHVGTFQWICLFLHCISVDLNFNVLSAQSSRSQVSTLKNIFTASVRIYCSIRWYYIRFWHFDFRWNLSVMPDFA